MSGNDFWPFGIGKVKWPSLLSIFVIGNGNEKVNFKLLGLEMGRKNSVSNPTWERIDKRVSGKCCEWEFPFMPAPLVADLPDATPRLDKINPFQIYHFKLLALLLTINYYLR